MMIKYPEIYIRVAYNHRCTVEDLYRAVPNASDYDIERAGHLFDIGHLWWQIKMIIELEDNMTKFITAMNNLCRALCDVIGFIISSRFLLRRCKNCEYCKNSEIFWGLTTCTRYPRWFATTPNNYCRSWERSKSNRNIYNF